MDEKRPRRKTLLDEHGEKIHPETIELHNAAKAAIAVLEKLDGYPAAQRDAGMRITAEFEKSGKHLPRPLLPNEDRLKYELAVFDIMAEEFLRLVSSVETQKSYLALLLSWASDVWDRYRGISPINAHEDNPAVLEINSHRSRWAIAGWDRAASKKPIREKAVAKRSHAEPRRELLENADVTSLGRINAAKALGLSLRTFDRWVKDPDKRLTPVGPPSRKKYQVRDLKRLLAGRNLDNGDIK